MSFQRSVYYAANGDCLRPFDQAANLPERKVTYFVQELMARLGMEETHADSQSFYADFFAHSVSSHTIEEVLIQSASNYPAYSEAKVTMPEDTAGTVGVVSFDGKGVRVVPDEQTTGKTREALLGCVYHH